jgi:flagella basal body P-ring formation protein FlgA
MGLLQFVLPAILAANLATASPKPWVALQFLDSTAVNDSVIRLCDIASVESTSYSCDLNKVLEAIVGESAPAGFCRRVSTDEVLNYVLKAKFPNFGFRKIPKKSVRVSTSSLEKSIGEYEKLIGQYFRDSVAWKPGDYTMMVRNSDEKFRCLNKPIVAAVSGMTSRYPRGIVNLMLTIKQGTRTCLVPVVCMVTVTTVVVVANKPIARGTQLDESNCSLCRRDITRFGYEPVSSLSDVHGMLALRTIPKETIVYCKMVSHPPLVLKDDQVIVVVGRGRVKVSIAMRAREAGALGDKILVENETSHRLFKTKIIGKGEVTIMEGGNNI